MKTAILASFALLGGCAIVEAPEADDMVTLYRNSPYSSFLRVHWATFDAADGIAYNRGNCEMAARVLNANLAASAQAKSTGVPPDLGFWCEDGTFDQTGKAPAEFEAEFPSDTTSSMRFTD
ncbi:MAG: hypothetical protein V2I39_14305 [Erythrobacter sp.]|jgi:hypothetical protein|nr:hypothetical protein [Erythrobacter sp.]